MTNEIKWILNIIFFKCFRFFEAKIILFKLDKAILNKNRL